MGGPRGCELGEGKVIPTTRVISDPYALTVDIAAEVRETVRTGLKGTGRSANQLAADYGIDSSRVDAWLKKAHVPLYILRHPKTPLRTALRIIADLLAARAEEARSGRTVEGSTGMMIEIAGKLCAIAGRALADGRIDPAERGELRTLIAELRDRCNAWLVEHGGETPTSVARIGGRT